MLRRCQAPWILVHKSGVDSIGEEEVADPGWPGWLRSRWIKELEVWPSPDCIEWGMTSGALGL